MRLTKNKKGYQIGDLLTFGIMFVVLTVALSFGATILTDIRDDQTQNDTDYNITTKGIDAVLNLAKWTPNLATIIVAAIIIGILMTAFVYKMRE